MASKKKIAEVIAAIKTIYPYYAGDNDVTILAKTWESLLKAYDDQLVDAALMNCLGECKMPPTPADIIEKIRLLDKVNQPSAEDMWVLLADALEKTSRQVSMFPYTYIDETGISQGQQARNRVEKIWEDLPPLIKDYVASKGELIRLSREYAESRDFANYEKARFMKNIPEYDRIRENSSRMRIGEPEHRRYALNEAVETDRRYDDRRKDLEELFGI
jgi:hypothetical protein